MVGIIFNYLLDNSSKVYEYFTKNPMIKGFIGGIITIILFLLVGDNYNGLGQNYISNSFLETTNLLDFVWKIIFTTVALGSVFQGGRGNPIFFVGATLGSAIAIYFNLPLEAVAALGMIGVFCTMTALPITAVIMFMEYFGSKEIIGIIIIITICYMFSGYYDLITKNKMDRSKSNLLKGTIK